MNWQRDRGLIARLFLSSLLIFLVYAAIAVPFVYVFLADRGLLLMQGVGITLVATLVVLLLFGDRLTRWVAGGVVVSPEALPELHARLDKLAQIADMSTPRVAVVSSEEPNAFTAGSGRRAVVCVTTGLLRQLPPDEQDAVLAHELAHIKNRDGYLMPLIAFPLTLSLFLLLAVGKTLEYSGKHAMRAFIHIVFLSLAALMVALPLLLVSYLPVVAVSRYREYAADRGAVAITGNPSALASALERFDHGDTTADSTKPERDLRTLGAVNAFCIIPTESGWFSLPELHPPTEQRIERLRTLEREAETD